MRFRRVVAIVLGLAVIILVAMAWGAQAPEIAPVARPDPASLDRKLVARGETLAGLGSCVTCHTRDGGEAYAGGLALPTPFGTVYTTNITPHPETGIGTWSKDAFVRAMRDGVNRSGNHLYPAFPYDHFTKVTDQDLAAIFAYLMSAVEPVDYRAPENELGFPWNVRQGLAVWKALFLSPGPWTPDPAKDAEWNRGAYLAEGLGHCGSCHSPRNMLGAVQGGSAAYAGAVVEGWHAPALNKDSPAPIPWTQSALVNYLMDGWHQQHGIAAGPMIPVVNNLREQPEDDVFAIAAYILSLQGGPLPPPEHAAREQKAKAFAERVEWATSDNLAVPAEHQEGARVFQARCAECHRRGGKSVPLALSSQVNYPDPASLIRVVVDGIKPPQGALGRSMPALGGQISDPEMTALMRFIRARFSTRSPWENLDDAVRRLRHKG